jgi:hypothetical protein
MKVIRTASILHNDSSFPGPHFGKRVKLNLIRENGEYRWYCESGEDTEVSGSTVAAACDAARASWSGVWDFQAAWA